MAYAYSSVLNLLKNEEIVMKTEEEYWDDVALSLTDWGFDAGFEEGLRQSREIARRFDMPVVFYCGGDYEVRISPVSCDGFLKEQYEEWKRWLETGEF